MRRMHHLLGAVLLISGTTVGAAILALPIVAGLSGFGLSVAIMVVCWLYLLMAAFYIVEVNLSFDLKEVNLFSMAERTLGSFGKVVCWGAYLFLLYTLNTAYIFVTLEFLQQAIGVLVGRNIGQIVCVLPLVVLFALFLRSGTAVIDMVNRVVMTVLIVCFFILIGLAVPHMHLEFLTGVNILYIVPALSVVLTAFGYHVVIPSIVSYLHRNVADIKKAILVGSFLPLGIYILWQMAVLGVVPAEGPVSIASAHGDSTNGAAILATVAESSAVTTVSKVFVFCAVITSFFGVSLSLFDFLADALKVNKHSASKWKLFIFTFVPPLYFALSDPAIFFKSLQYAGVFGVVVLLALLPGLMVWRKRYVLQLKSSYTVPGGKTALALFIVFSVALIIVEIMR